MNDLSLKRLSAACFVVLGLLTAVALPIAASAGTFEGVRQDRRELVVFSITTLVDGASLVIASDGPEKLQAAFLFSGLPE